jgi:hypothetical protein
VDESPGEVEHIPLLQPAVEDRHALFHVLVREIACAKLLLSGFSLTAGLARETVVLIDGRVDLPPLASFQLQEKRVHVVPMRREAGGRGRRQIPACLS